MNSMFCTENKQTHTYLLALSYSPSRPRIIPRGVYVYVGGFNFKSKTRPHLREYTVIKGQSHDMTRQNIFNTKILNSYFSCKYRLNVISDNLNGILCEGKLVQKWSNVYYFSVHHSKYIGTFLTIFYDISEYYSLWFRTWSSPVNVNSQLTLTIHFRTYRQAPKSALQGTEISKKLRNQRKTIWKRINKMKDESK